VNSGSEQNRQRLGRAPAPILGLFPSARAGRGSLGQDGIPDATSEATDVESGGARIPYPGRVELQELVAQSPLEVAAAGGRWPRRARSERGTEGLNQRCLAASVPVGHVVQRRPNSQQCAAGCFKGITQAFVEPREANDAARGRKLRVEFVQLDRRRELPIDQPLEICHHSVHALPDRPKGARLLRRARVMRVAGPPRGSARLGGASLVDGGGEDNGADQAEQGLKRGGGCGPLLEGLAHVFAHAERLELAHLGRRRSPAAPRPLL
jgi:hypothetical protein